MILTGWGLSAPARTCTTSFTKLLVGSNLSAYERGLIRSSRECTLRVRGALRAVPLAADTAHLPAGPSFRVRARPPESHHLRATQGNSRASSPLVRGL
jgi:hypothetical protein